MLGHPASSANMCCSCIALQHAGLVRGKFKPMNIEPSDLQPQPPAPRRPGDLASAVARAVSEQRNQQDSEMANDDETGVGYDTVRRSFTSPLARRIANAVRREYLQ